MALSMPLNGLKEEDKEPVIELFVKVSARPPSRRAEPPGARPPDRGGRRPCAPGAPRPRRPRRAPARRPLPGPRASAPAPPAHCLGPTRAFPPPGPVGGAGAGPGPPAARTRGGGHRFQLRGLRRTPDRRLASGWEELLRPGPRTGVGPGGPRPGSLPPQPRPGPAASQSGDAEPNFLQRFPKEHFASRWLETVT